ncbi:hypothetical protein CBL_05127 [Carabus blaptoides fortunei]
MENASSSSSSDWEEDIETLAAFTHLESVKSRRLWVHDINKQREKLGEFHKLVPELQKDPKRFHMYFRMTKEQFDFLHELIENDIKKQHTQFRRAVIEVDAYSAPSLEYPLAGDGDEKNDF